MTLGGLPGRVLFEDVGQICREIPSRWSAEARF